MCKLIEAIRWKYTSSLHWDTLDIHGLVYVGIVVADVLVPDTYQAIFNYHAN